MSMLPSLCLSCSGKMIIWASLRKSSNCRRSSAMSTTLLSANSSYQAIERRPHSPGEWVTLSMSSVEMTALLFSITGAMVTQTVTVTSSRYGRRRFHRVPLVPSRSNLLRKRSSGPTARWYLIQPTLSSSNGDVLLLLDCCHAGQAARDRFAHKFQLLAAATMNLVTPGPTASHKSFTSVLISELTALAVEPNGFLVSELHARMVRKEAGLQ